MCGIVGYIGSKEAYPVLIKGLHRLEYRGYDSSGVAMISDEGKLNIYKAKGKVAALEHFAESKDRSGTVGIAHTRWATHGEPNDTNAHPHASQSVAAASSRGLRGVSSLAAAPTMNSFISFSV